MYFEILLVLLSLLYLFYKWSIKTYKTFEERGVAHKKPLPLIGNSLEFAGNQSSLHKVMLNLYRETKQHKIFGFYNFRDPFFIVNDPALIKLMGIKDFDSFTNHQQFLNSDKDPLFSGMLSVMKNQRWKNMRNTMTPIFTGAKMRAMFTLMNECFAESMKYLQEQFHVESTSIDIELRDCFTRLSNDLIATTAFGLKINSYLNKNNEFYKIGTSFSKMRGRQAIKFMINSIAPKISELLGFQIFDKKTTDYFMHLVIDAMKYREEHKIIRPDMIQLLLEAKRESEHQWTDEDIVAQCFIFFFAAFENNANLLCTACYELMENPNIQQKLYNEIMNVQRELGEKTLDYDTLTKMKYLDMVLSETLRKWPLGPLIDRACGKDYTVKDENGKFVCDLKEGDRIWFQVFGLQRNDEYFEQSELFDPERFSAENKHKINQLTYLPFGIGPRICIGNRYALMQAKAMLYYLLKDFKLERSEKTCENLLDDLRGFQIIPKSGFWFKLVKREEVTEL